MTEAQALTLVKLTANANNLTRVTISFFPFDLPEGYIYVKVDRDGHVVEYGIAPDGAASS